MGSRDLIGGAGQGPTEGQGCAAVFTLALTPALTLALTLGLEPWDWVLGSLFNSSSNYYTPLPQVLLGVVIRPQDAGDKGGRGWSPHGPHLCTRSVPPHLL